MLLVVMQLLCTVRAVRVVRVHQPTKYNIAKNRHFLKNYVPSSTRVPVDPWNGYPGGGGVFKIFDSLTPVSLLLLIYFLRLKT